jgi:mRNA interferase RelE/StbE
VPYELHLTKAAEKDMLGLPPKLRRRIDAEILSLADQPRPDGVVKLKGTRGDLWRVRVGSFRVIYRVDDAEGVVEIGRILDRKEAYRAI